MATLSMTRSGKRIYASLVEEKVAVDGIIPEASMAEPTSIHGAPDDDVEAGLPTCPFIETTLALKDVRVLELRSMMRRGAENADAVVLRSGCFGGEGPNTIRLFIVLGWSNLFYGVLGGYVAGSGARNGLTNGRVALNGIRMVCYIIMSISLFLRAYLLRSKRRRAAHNAGIVALILAAFSFGALNLLAFFVLMASYASSTWALTCHYVSRICLMAICADLMRTAAALHEGRFSVVTARLMRTFRVMILASILLDIIHDGDADWDESMTFWVNPLELPLFCLFIFLIIFAIYLTLLRQQNALKADRVVAHDRARYDEVWARLTHESGDDFCFKLARFEDAVERAEVRQDAVEPKTPLARALAKVEQAKEISGSLKPRQFVDDLAVLLAQAAALNSHFQELVSARLPGGEHRPAAIKSRVRAIEKLYRSYAGDASRLVDLVRTIVVFDDLDALVAAVEALREDPVIAILSSKNSLAATHDSKESAGYRNVNLSVLIVDPFTTSQGLDAHICELQLGLRAIEALRNDKGHANYIKWRNINAT